MKVARETSAVRAVTRLEGIGGLVFTKRTSGAGDGTHIEGMVDCCSYFRIFTRLSKLDGPGIGRTRSCSSSHMPRSPRGLERPCTRDHWFEFVAISIHQGVVEIRGQGPPGRHLDLQVLPGEGRLGGGGGKKGKERAIEHAY